MHAQFGHPSIQKRIFKYFKQYKEEQSGLLITTIPIFPVLWLCMMQDSEWPTLEERRWVTKVTMLFKNLNASFAYLLTSI